LPPVDRDDAAPGRQSSRPELAIGRYLARQRRLRGVSLDELAGLTKIPLRSLERLEDGAFDHQVDGFARGFVRTVAEALGLDAEEAVMRLLGEPPSGGDEGFALRRLSLRRWALGSALLLGGVAAIFVFWSLWSGDALGPADEVFPEIVYRRDVVRELAEAQRASDAAGKPLDSTHEGHPD
jgi:hypothetical protein